MGCVAERGRAVDGLHSFLAGPGTFLPPPPTTKSLYIHKFILVLTPPQRQKIYVQDLIRQHSALVYDLLANKNGIFYICGSSGKMPQAIREALIEGFQRHGEMSREAAEAYLAAMEKAARYRQETW